MSRTVWVLTIFLGCADPVAVLPAPREDAEAEWLALEFDSTISASSATYEAMHRDLELIRKAFPDLASYERASNTTTVFVATQGGCSKAGHPSSRAWRSAATRLRLHADEWSEDEDLRAHEALRWLGRAGLPVARTCWLRLVLEGRYSEPEVLAELTAIEGVRRESGYSGRPRIQVRRDSDGSRLFSFLEWSDCPAGCIERSRREVRVDDGGARGVNPAALAAVKPSKIYMQSTTLQARADPHAADRSAVAPWLKGFAQCLENGASRRPNLEIAGLTVVFAVGLSGVVTSASLEPVEDAPSELSECVVRVARRVTFPTSDEERVVRVPLSFSL